jgi:putative transposase
MIIMQYKHSKNVTYSSKYHVVWCCKYRRKVLTPEVQQKLKEIILGVCQEKHADMMFLEVMEDHIHLLVEVNPQYGIHRLVKQVKGRSSRLLRKEFKHLTTRLPSLWTNSYFVATVGGAPLSVIKKYVEQQKSV